jgi:hypothetical protein
LRSKAEKRIIPLNELTAWVRVELAALEAEISASVLPVEYNG